jgi:hypothetical protein
MEATEDTRRRHGADLPPEKQVILYAANDVVRRIGIEFQAYQKPLKVRKRPLEDPLVSCDPIVSGTILAEEASGDRAIR